MTSLIVARPDPARSDLEPDPFHAALGGEGDSLMTEHEKKIVALEARVTQLTRELSSASQDVDALGHQLSVLERVGVDLLGGTDAHSVLEEALAESRRVLEITGFHEREDGTTFLCECSRCVKRERAVDRGEGEVSP